VVAKYKERIMGWASGSGLFSNLIETLKDNVKEHETRKIIYEEFIALFEDADCDTLDECVGIDTAFDEVWEELYPGSSFEADDEDDWD
jgi:hypothetical protein